MAESVTSRKGFARAVTAAKLAVTLLLCSLIIWKADWERIGETLKNADGAMVGVVFVSMVLCVTISAYKWQLLLRIHGVRFGFGWLHRLYFTSMFFNNFLPTSIGGDGYRIYRTLDNQRSKTAAFVAVFMERFSGITSLLLLGYCGAWIGYLNDSSSLSRTVVLAGLIGTAVAAPVAVLILNRRFRAWLTSFRRFPAVIYKLLEHLGDYRRRPDLALKVVLVSFGFHFFTVWWLMTLVGAVGSEVSYYDLLVVSAVLSVVAVIPVSINGIGVVDGAFIYLAGHYGVSYEPALMTMLLQRALMLPISVAGAAFYFFDRQRASTFEAERARQETALRSEY